MKVLEDRRVGSTAPDRSLAQRMDALAKANDVRVRRADLKRELRAGRVHVRDVLLDPPEWAETMKVVELLLAVPKHGRVKVNKVVVRSGISPSKSLGGLTVRQRAELVSLLGR